MAARHRQAKKALRGELLPKVDCGECGKPCGLVDGRTVYPHRPDLANKKLWRCAACGAYVGCHDGTVAPLGSPCGPDTRRARREAHAVFDPLWRRKIAKEGIAKRQARKAAYRWLSEQLGTEFEKTHIGMFDAAMARRVVDLCAPFARAAA